MTRTRSARSKRKTDGEPSAPPSNPSSPPEHADDAQPVVAAIAALGPGLYAVEVAAGSDGEAEPPPRVWLAQLPSDGGGSLQLLSAAGEGAQWLDGTGSLVAVRVSDGAALLSATAFGSAERAPALPRLTLQALETGRAPAAMVLPLPLSAPLASPAATPSDPAPPPLATPQVEGAITRTEREIPVEVLAHIERVGDRTFGGSAWAGRPGDKRRLEGFSIRPLQELQPNEIEYKALHPGGIETPWVPGPQFCGTRGRGLPITGLSIRIASHVQDQFSVIYQAAFFRSGISEPRGNGAPCLPALAGDVLEGINIRILRGRAV